MISDDPMVLERLVSFPSKRIVLDELRAKLLAFFWFHRPARQSRNKKMLEEAVCLTYIITEEEMNLQIRQS